MSDKLKKMSELEERLLMLLPYGSKNLITTKELENILGLDSRTIRGMIEELISEYGIPICAMREAGHSGYFIPTNQDEKVRGTAALSKQVKTMQRRIDNVENADIGIAYRYKEKIKKKYRKEDEDTEQLGLNLVLTDGNNKQRQGMK